MSAAGASRGGEFEALHQRLQGTLSSIGSMAAEVEQRGKQTAARDAAQDEARAKRARAGELGPEWRRLQQRIDLGQTSLHDALTGADDSPEARALLDNSRRSLRKLADEVNEEEADSEEPSEMGVALSEIRLLNSSIASRLEALKRFDLN